MNKKKKLYMIGNAHIDTVWMWQWQEGYQEVKATFRSVLDRMKEYDDFIFTGSSAYCYEWIEENEPSMFEEIKERIKQGRWVIVGGWWTEPDLNAPAGESYVRQALYGQRYFNEKFGVMADTGYNIDSFGHNGMLPQILKKTGISNYVFMRPGRHEKGLESETFCWRSKDESEVIAFRLPFEYCTWPDGLKEHIKRCEGEIKEEGGSIMCFYGVGNHGGGPTIKNIESIYELNKQEDMPELLFSSPAEYFKDIKKSGRTLPVVYGELLHHSSGCYSAHSGVKAQNRRAENRLLTAETFSILAKELSNGKSAQPEYSKAWKEVLLNQFHDIMAGTSILPAYEDANESYGFALHTAAKGLNAAIQSISWHIDIPMEEGMKPIVVFNPHGFPAKMEVEMESPSLKEGTVLLDDTDREIPYQLVQSMASSNGRCRISFIADLPSLGWRTFRLAVRKTRQVFEPVCADEHSAENQWFKIEWDEKTGYITSLLKKNDETQYFSGPAGVPVVIGDKSDTWSHGVLRFDKEIGRFSAVSVKKVESGPVKCVIRVTSQYGKSKIIQDFSVYKELDYVRVKTWVDWHEKQAMLKLAFPMELNYLRNTHEIPYGVVQREPDGAEYPMQAFVDVEGTNPGMTTNMNGLSILNDGKFAVSTDKKTVSLTILRSPVYANHEPYELCNDLEYVYMDQGVQTFAYGLYPHDGSWESAETVKLSRQFNAGPVALFETFHKGELPCSLSFLEISEPNIILNVFKEAEDGSGDKILRLYETAGRKTEAVICMKTKNREIKASFRPFEIKTLRISGQDFGGARECDMLER